MTASSLAFVITGSGRTSPGLRGYPGEENNVLKKGSCVCVNVPHVWRQCPWRQENGSGSPGTGVMGCCELTNNGAGNKTLVLRKNRKVYLTAESKKECLHLFLVLDKILETW